MVDYIADYLQNIRKRRVFPDVSPGYMRALIPESAPERGEDWYEIFRDVERVIMPGVSVHAGKRTVVCEKPCLVHGSLICNMQGEGQRQTDRRTDR